MKWGGERFGMEENVIIMIPYGSTVDTKYFSATTFSLFLFTTKENIIDC